VRKSNSIKIKNFIIRYESSEGEDEQKDKPVKNKAKKRWRMMLNLVKAVNCMKTFDIQEINSVRDIDHYLQYKKSEEVNKKSKTDKQKNKANNNSKELKDSYFNKEGIIQEEKSEQEMESNYNLVVREDTIENLMFNYAKQDELMKLASQGDDLKLKKFKTYIMEDPKRNVFSKSEKNRYFVNETNTEGYTLLYQACLNGHINYIKLLLDCDADHLIKCGKKKEEQLSVLDAAVRWNHSKVVNYLLTENEFKLDWPSEYIKTSIRIADSMGNKNLVKILKKALLKQKPKGCFFICG
jgi:hypothetical protein